MLSNYNSLEQEVIELERERIIARLQIRDQRRTLECEDRYYNFFKDAWYQQEPETPLEDNWHIEYLCDILQAEIERIAAKTPRQKDIIINISPRESKSKMVSINLAPWAWIKYPWIKFINSSHSEKLSTDHCVKSRWLIESHWYQSRWGDRFQMMSDQNVKTYYVNDKGGARIATSVGSKISGQGADMVIADDLIDPEDSDSDKARSDANDHYGALYDRLNNKKVGVRILVMQRVHIDDPTGKELRERKGKYNLICLPAEDSDKVHPPELRKFYVNGIFDPKRLDKEIIEDTKKIKGTWKYNALYLQDPKDQSGGIIKREWWKFYYELPKKFDFMMQSWDMNFKGQEPGKKKKLSYVVGTVWGKLGPNAYLIYRFRAQIGFTSALVAVAKTCQDYPQAIRKIVEDKANGPAILDVLQKKFPGFKAVNPQGSKIARTNKVSPIIESGNVILPHPSIYPGIEDFLDEHTAFPNPDWADDQVDSTTQALDDMFFKGNRLDDLLKM